MREKSYYRYVELIFVLVVIFLFFRYRSSEIFYGLPYFWNRDEISFQASTLSSLSILTGYFEKAYNPFYASFFNLIIILKSIFINEFLINSLSIEQIKSKIYFNTELFLYYGRLASVIITSFSIFCLYLILKKLKINSIILSTLIITFATSLVALDVSTIMSKNSCYLLIYLIQLYYFIKFKIKIEYFCYPFGIHNEAICEIVKESGYFSALTMIRGRVKLKSDRFRLPRIPVNHHTLPHLFLTKVLTSYEDKK